LSRVLRRGEINLTFRQNFDTTEIAEWEDLEAELEGVQLADEEDSVRWMLIPHEQFTTSMLYEFYSFPGARNLKMEEMWHSNLPLKVKNFIWMVDRNRIQTMDNLGRKTGKGASFANFVILKKV
jgi:hypothetical protein